MQDFVLDSCLPIPILLQCLPMDALFLYLMIPLAVPTSIHLLLNLEVASKTEVQVDRGLFGGIWCIDTKICCSGSRCGFCFRERDQHSPNSRAAQLLLTCIVHLRFALWAMLLGWASFRGP